MFAKFINKYKAMPLTAKAAMWFVMCTMLQKCISFITVPIFTRLMPTAEYGIYSIYLSWYSIVAVICSLEMHTCVYINGVVKANTEEEKNAVAMPLLSLTGTITFVLFVIYLVFHNWLNRFIGLPTALVCLIFARVLFEPPVLFWSIKQRYEYKYIKMVIRTISMVICNAVLGVIFVVLAEKNQAAARVVSTVIVQIVFGAGFYIYFIKRGKQLFSTKGWLHAFNVQLPLVPHGLSLTVLSSSDRIMINNLVGAAEAGIYSVAYSAGYIVNVLKSSIIDAMRPWIYEKIKRKEYEQIREKTKPILILVMLMTFAFVAFAPEIIYIMAPKQYHQAVYVIPPVAASSFFTFLYNIFSSVSFYYEKTKKIMFASLAGAIANLALNAICIPIFGYIAAGYTTMVCYMFFSITHYLIMKSISKNELNNIKIFDLKFIFAMSAVVIIMSVLFAFVYKNIYARYAIILIIAIIILLKRNLFINTLSTMKKKE